MSNEIRAVWLQGFIPAAGFDWRYKNKMQLIAACSNFAACYSKKMNSDCKITDLISLL